MISRFSDLRDGKSFQESWIKRTVLKICKGPFTFTWQFSRAGVLRSPDSGLRRPRRTSSLKPCPMSHVTWAMSVDFLSDNYLSCPRSPGLKIQMTLDLWFHWKNENWRVIMTIVWYCCCLFVGLVCCFVFGKLQIIC